MRQILSYDKKDTVTLLKSILVLSIPLIVGELGSIAQQFADTMMVGNHSTEELAASGMVNNIFIFVIFFSLGISYAITPLVGNAFGRKDMADVRRIMLEGVILNFISGIILSLILWLLLANIEILGQPVQLLTYAKPYFKLLIVSVPFLTVFFAFKQYLDGLGRPQASMWIMLAANIQNIILNWMLIYGHCGMPELGLVGAGISTLISRILQLAVIVIVVLVSLTKEKSLGGDHYHSSFPSFRGVWAQFRLGLPVAVQLSLELSIFGACSIFMGWLGKYELAAHQVMYVISTLCFQVLYGIGAANCIMISQMRGAGSFESIKRCSKVSFILSLSVITVITILLILFFDPVISCFTTSGEVKSVLYFILPWFVLYQVGDCLQVTYGNALRGLEQTRPLMQISIISYVLISIPISCVLGSDAVWGVHGVWIGIPIGLSLAGLLFYRKFNKKLKVIA